MRIVIVGGGVIGSSIAFHLASHPKFAGSVTVIERDPLYARASSALSASSVRQQFSTGVNIAMSQYGFAFLRDAGDILAVAGDKPAIGLRETGYLYLASATGPDALRENNVTQRALGADVVLLQPDAIVARFPWLCTEGVALGALGLSGEGSFDGPALLHAFRRKARSLGVAYVAQDAVGLACDANRVVGVTLADGSTMDCDIAVNAAGPWAARVAQMAGIALPVRARRRMVFVIACRAQLPDCPLVIDPSGIWFRAEGTCFLTGRCPGEGEDDPDEVALDVDEAMFHERIWPVLAERVPAFESLKLASSWAGYYEMNVFDHNAVIGAHPAFPNLIFANGFSGHGMQHSPAAGRGVAELILEGGFTSLDLSPLGFARVLENRPLLERNVV